MVRTVLKKRPHPQQGFRACLGIIHLGKTYGKVRLEGACRRALALQTTSYKSIQSILKHKLDRQPLPSSETPAKMLSSDTYLYALRRHPVLRT